MSNSRQFQLDSPSELSGPSRMQPLECRDGRIQLGCTLEELAAGSGFSVEKITEFEEGRQALPTSAGVALRRYLRKALRKKQITAVPLVRS
jgi:hypothetical protein